jgi:hypothetical protein
VATNTRATVAELLDSSFSTRSVSCERKVDKLSVTYQSSPTYWIIKTSSISDPVDKFTDWERFQSLPSELLSLRIQSNLGKEADKAARDFTASIASAYRLSTSKITLSDLNKDLTGLESLLKHKRRLRKPRQVTRDPAYKTAVNRIAKTIRRMTRRKILERWEAQVGNSEVTPQALWPIAKSLL